MENPFQNGIRVQPPDTPASARADFGTAADETLRIFRSVGRSSGRTALRFRPFASLRLPSSANPSPSRGAWSIVPKGGCRLSEQDDAKAKTESLGPSRSIEGNASARSSFVLPQASKPRKGAAAWEEMRMPVRMTQETQDVIDGRRQVVVRVLFDRSEADRGIVEVAATVRVPAIASETQTESAARQMARQALERALSALPF
ncbi:MAG: hypothetical protein PGN25_00530 [Methylorubrum populi]